MEPKQITSMNSCAVGTLILAFVAVLVLALSMSSVMAQQSGMATYIEYKPDDPLVNWVYRDSQVCPSLDENYSDDYRSHHRWTEFCGRGNAEHSCLDCLQVTNAATSDDNPVPVTVRIVDICDNTNDGAVLRMDKVAFNQVAGGNDNTIGQLQVNYKFVDCEDEQ